MIKSSRFLALLTLLFTLALFNPTGTPAQEPDASFQLQTDQYGLFRLAPGITSGQLTFPLDRSNVVTVEIITNSDALTTSILAPGGQVIDPNNAEALGGSYTLIRGFQQQDSALILPSATPGFHHLYTFPWRGAGDYAVRFEAPANLSAETPVIVQVSTDSTIGVRLFAGEAEAHGRQRRHERRLEASRRLDDDVVRRYLR